MKKLDFGTRQKASRRRLISMFSAVATLIFTISPLSAHAKDSAMDTSRKQQVADLLKSIETGDPAPAAVVNPSKYIQHNLAVADGIAGFAALLQALPKGSARVNTVRLLQDGDLVAAHTEYEFFGPKIGFDIFRFENGKIVEHWTTCNPVRTNPTRAAGP